VIAIDGTKVAANASLDANRSYEWIVREILKEAEETDQAEDRRYGEARGDELPERLRTPEGRAAALAEAKRKLEVEQADQPQEPAEEPPSMPARRSTKAGAAGFARDAASSRSAAPARHGRSPALGPSASPSQSAGSRRSTAPIGRRTPPTRPTGRAG
jgi:hypothetical protein